MDREAILQALAQIESGGGRNFNHPTITHGLNKGTNAIGRYGLTHHTVNDIIRNMPSYNYLGQMNPVQKKSYLESNPNIEHDIAANLVERLQNRYNDPRQLAYAWNHGTSLRPESITPEILEKDQYTNKFSNLMRKINPNMGMPANNMPQNEDFSKKDGEILPTINIASLQDILNDPNNPFREDFAETDDVDPEIDQFYKGKLF